MNNDYLFLDGFEYMMLKNACLHRNTDIPSWVMVAPVSATQDS